MEQIYIFGHKKPDTDTVTAAISLSYLKNKLGLNTIPMVLGVINNETKFVLDHFKVSVPKELNDVHLQIKDLNYQKDCMVCETETISATFEYMLENKISSTSVENTDGEFLGVVAMKDIAKYLCDAKDDSIITSYDNLLIALKGNRILKINREFKGKMVFLNEDNQEELDEYINDNIIVMEPSPILFKNVLNKKPKLIILSGKAKISEASLEKAKNSKISLLSTTENVQLIKKKSDLSNYISKILFKENLVTFNEEDEVRDFIATANKTRYSYFPVINNSNKCLGMLKLADASNVNRKKVILVDHNSTIQSVEGIEEAEVLEIIDHHNIDFARTAAPINFRNMTVGSTNTIIYTMYKENNVVIPKSIAGIMLSGIISDTLLFTSPTTTDLDKDVAQKLSEIAEIDVKKYGREMFKKGSIFKNQSPEETMYSDFKTYNIGNEKIGIAQISTINVDDVLTHMSEYKRIIEKMVINSEYNVVILLIVDIMRKGSYLYYNEKARNVLENSFPDVIIEQGIFLDGYVSRKKQIVPCITKALEKII